MINEKNLEKQVEKEFYHTIFLLIHYLKKKRKDYNISSRNKIEITGQIINDIITKNTNEKISPILRFILNKQVNYWTIVNNTADIIIKSQL